MVNQTLGNELEIIVVDDGSNDHTWKICQQYQRLYPNIHIFYEENHGQGQAREYGISFAHGEYIGFTDADDKATPNMFKSMYEFAKENNDDIVVCDVQKVWVEKNYVTKFHSMPQSTGKLNIGEYIKSGLNNAYLHNKIFKRDIWHHYHFKSMVYEDLDIVLTILSYAHKVGYLQEPFYVYYKHAGSTTSSYTNPRLFDIFHAYRDIMNDINPIYYDQAAYQVATRILRNMSTPGFIYYRADFIELIQSLKGVFLNNKELCGDLINSRIFYFMGTPTVPNTLVSTSQLDISWEKMGNHPYTYIQPNLEKALIFLYQHGGILIDGNFKIASPYDYLRSLNQAAYFDEKRSLIVADKFSPLVWSVLKKVKTEHSNLQTVLKDTLSNSNSLTSDTQILTNENINKYLKFQ